MKSPEVWGFYLFYVFWFFILYYVQMGKRGKPRLVMKLQEKHSGAEWLMNTPICKEQV